MKKHIKLIIILIIITTIATAIILNFSKIENAYVGEVMHGKIRIFKCLPYSSNKIMIYQAKRYQKIYHFETTDDKYATWNNESDAFKHAFGGAEISLKLGPFLGKLIYDFYEEIYGDICEKQPQNENLMDKWNNNEGQKIADEIYKECGNNIFTVYKLFYNDTMDDIIAQKVAIKIKNGDLITNPKDKRLNNLTY